MSTINKETFNKIFNNREDILAMMASSLTRKNINIFKNNITCDLDNRNNKQYIIWMPEDNIIKIKNTKNDKIITVNLNNKNMWYFIHFLP